MLDMKEFQKRLETIFWLAVKNDKRLELQEVASCFAEDELSSEQMKSVYEYLRIKGIQLEEGAAEVQTGQEEEMTEAAPLSAQEQAYLEEYEESLAQIETGAPQEIERLFNDLANGDSMAKARLTELFLKEVISIAKECHHKDVFIGDMIQEGNICLMTALENEIPDSGAYEWLQKEIRSGMKQMVREQTQIHFWDNCLVERVNNLEAAIKKLTDNDEDTKFSIEELSAYLDMDVEEIRRVLRLTGEE